MYRIAVLAIAALTLSTGCATIMHGTTQDIGFASTPSQATVKVNGVTMGNTPVVAKLQRNQTHVVRIELDGYQPYETMLTKHVSGWVWGNLVFGGIVGLAVDATTGGLYKLSPEQVQAQMAQATQAGTPRGTETSSATKSGDGIFIRVVLQPEADWVRVGQMARE